MFFWESTVREMTAGKTQVALIASPMTQKGFLANFSLPLHPLYRQQQPAAHILTMYSTPNTTMVTISCGMKQKGGVDRVTQIYCVYSRVLLQIKRYLPGCTRHSLSYFWTLWWWQRLRVWDRRRPGGICKRYDRVQKKLLLFLFNTCHLINPVLDRKYRISTATAGLIYNPRL